MLILLLSNDLRTFIQTSRYGYLSWHDATIVFVDPILTILISLVLLSNLLIVGSRIWSQIFTYWPVVCGVRMRCLICDLLVFFEILEGCMN